MNLLSTLCGKRHNRHLRIDPQRGGKDRAVNNPEVFKTMNSQVWIDHRFFWIGSHAAGAQRMKSGCFQI